MSTKLIGLKELAENCGISFRLAKQYANEGRIPGAQILGNKWKAPEDAKILTIKQLQEATTKAVASPVVGKEPVKEPTYKEIYAKIKTGNFSQSDVTAFGVMVKGVRDAGALAEYNEKLYTIEEIDEKAKQAFENETKYHELAIKYQEKLDGLQEQERQISGKVERLTALGKTISRMRRYLAECVFILNKSRIADDLPKFPKGITDDDLDAFLDPTTVSRIINTESPTDESGDEMYDESPDDSADTEDTPEQEPEPEPEAPKELPMSQDLHKYPYLMIHFNEEYTGAKKMRLEKPMERLQRLILMKVGAEPPKFVDKYDPLKDKMLQKQLKAAETKSK
jgi:hypothetical protein